MRRKRRYKTHELSSRFQFPQQLLECHSSSLHPQSFSQLKQPTIITKLLASQLAKRNEIQVTQPPPREPTQKKKKKELSFPLLC